MTEVTVARPKPWRSASYYRPLESLIGLDRLLMLSGLVRHARKTFHVLVGVAFLCLAAAGAVVSFTEWQEYRRAPAIGPVTFTLVASFTVVLLIFCLYSFVKARSVR